MNAIESAVRSWPGVEALPHRFSGREFALAGRELGHSHGERQVDVPFPRRVRDVVVEEGLASEHHLFPESGWVTKYLDSADDVEEAVLLLRVAYLLRVVALQRRREVDPVVAGVDVVAAVADLDLPEGLAALVPGDGASPT